MTLHDLDSFSPDYATAKARFKEAAASVGAQLAAYPVGPSAGEGEPLTIDVAVVPGQVADRTVVISSGLHGVEGFFGSALQLAWLHGLAEGRTSRPDGNLVMIHALNPYGFQQRRRFDANNVDLNRNFLAEDQEYSGQPDGYRELAPLLNPPGPPVVGELFLPRALLSIYRHGLRQLKATVAVGQYEFPQGLFFGGCRATATTTIVQDQFFSEWTGNARHIVHVDLHTGLGPRGRAKLLLIDPPGAPGLPWYGKHFGEGQLEPLRTEGIAYAARGVMGAWLQRHADDRDYRFLVAEFGTHSPLRVLAALRAENRAFHACQPDDPRLERARRELVECFCPASRRWRRAVLTRGLQIIANAQRAATDLASGQRPAV